MPLAQALAMMLFRKGALGRDRAEQHSKVADRLRLDCENLNFENVPAEVQGSVALGLSFSLLTAEISLNPPSKI